MHKPTRPKSAKGRTRTSRNFQENSYNNQDSTLRDSAAAVPESASRSSKHSTITSTFLNSGIPTPSSGVPDSANTDVSPSVVMFPEINRPTSSLSRYRILPSIADTGVTGESDSWYTNVVDSMDGRASQMELLTEQAQQMILDSSVQSFVNRPTPPPSSSKRKVVRPAPSPQHKRQKTYQTRSIFSSSQSSVLKDSTKPRIPKEPGPNESRLLIALKLPDGTRVERFFHPEARLIGVLAYAHSQYPILPISQCNLFRMDVVPKKLLSNTDLSLSEVGIENRTVLYVEEVDDE